MFDFDLLVIGAGPGGQTAALRAAKLGKRWPWRRHGNPAAPA